MYSHHRLFPAVLACTIRQKGYLLRVYLPRGLVTCSQAPGRGSKAPIGKDSEQPRIASQELLALFYSSAILLLV